jgi:LPPG:FO 2-phospho-L-lactate transferase
MIATAIEGREASGGSDMAAAILERTTDHRNLRTVLLSGGVGGARLALGLAAVLPPGRLTVIVNIADDDVVYGLHVSPDVDTVVYTLAGIAGPEGWGIAGDEFRVLERLGGLGTDVTFRLGDRDLATCLYRTEALTAGMRLSEVTRALVRAFGLETIVLPASDDPIRTRLRTPAGEWLDFQQYFVHRGHRDDVDAVEYRGADTALPAPGVLAALQAADVVVIAPSNPPLSIWPVLSVPGIRDAVAAAAHTVAVSPLFGGKALKGPADRVMAGLGLPPGNAGVLAAYDDLLDALIIDEGDRTDAIELDTGGVTIHTADTRIAGRDAAAAFADKLLASVPVTEVP